ncbi:UDP-N-acetylmuramoyl-tripeptide--D-alanyl-D-alanine ligase [Acuticoccus sp. MNP-M23]|uniref:UDP-N-acetylmuramoyl-tripeptide--D-alanyl-D- alanine ligase n=1 Tax=Acuticoccus sp. MNP-M23 TaxID=3072793 RepID=UPI002814C508|nr:UDP-N-acetylmuramoyl-tripeptide--D-alanyl-D-alanine ligase [Acuticoccus sp. MNP-M23]WMS40850.1 UDP-N-acetylmuramoyl-tripeptide--D-alanyl-D-alanine ligase [Acuticoccus sp. MNP-M23]
MNKIWTLKTLSHAAGGRLEGAPEDTPVSGISIDTRTLGPGDAYFAIKGVRMDGHQFVPAALAAGASAAVVSHGEADRAIHVDDVLAALERVGIAARGRLGAETPVVAVTGSVGKTGTKEMLRLAFGPGTHAAAASYNNHWGVPLTLSRMPADASAGIFEIGMNHAGEITPLTRMVRPHIAIITTVQPVHLEFFDSVDGIADAKAEIFEGLDEGGTAIVPADIAQTGRLVAAAREKAARVVTFGAPDADVALVAYDPQSGAADAQAFGTRVRYTIRGGAHIARNSLAVLAALHAAGRPFDAIDALSGWSAQKGRGRRVMLDVAGGQATLLDEAYNANPASMGAAIVSLGATPATRRIAVLGDMLELGATAPDLHRGLVPLLVDAGVRIVHTVGTMTSHLTDSLPFEMRGLHCEDAAAMAEALPPLEPGDALLVKGSNAVGLGRVVEAVETRTGQER